MIQSILNFFGIGKREESAALTEGNTLSSVKTQSATRSPSTPPPAPKASKPRQPQMSLKKAVARKATTNPRSYYKRGRNYYSIDDDSLIEDIMLIYVLSELFSDADIGTFEAPVVEAPVEDLLDIDVSDTPVASIETVEPVGNYGNYTAPETPEPEPIRESASAGSSYSSGSSDSYDSGSDDSGGSDD